MRILFALLFAACSLSAFEVKAQETGGKDNWEAAERQVIALFLSFCLVSVDGKSLEQVFPSLEIVFER